jgi:hypothetical protein
MAITGWDRIDSDTDHVQHSNTSMNNRIVTIDFTKGILVLFMVIYHGLNYLGYESSPHYYLLFVPPSFILIAGFIITHVYVPKYGLTSRNLVSRLILRSCKLLLLFTLLNVGVIVVLSSQHAGTALTMKNFVRSWSEIYIIGGSRLAAFEVLLPIGYLLLLSVPVMRFQSLFPYVIGGVSLTTVAVCLVTGYYGYSLYNLYLISAGIIGMAIGLLPGDKITVVSYSWITLLSAYILYWCCFHLFGDIYIVQIFATLICLIIIYAVGSRIDLQSWLPRQSLLLGRYTLLSYIIQILYLQIFKRSPFYWMFEPLGIIVIVISTMMLTWVTILIVDYARAKNESFNDVYKLIFA